MLRDGALLTLDLKIVHNNTKLGDIRLHFCLLTWILKILITSNIISFTVIKDFAIIIIMIKSSYIAHFLT